MITQTAKYAVRAVGYMAGHTEGQPVLSRTIAEETHIPQNFLSKIMHRLVQASYLKSSRGTGGGFKLTKDPQEITLYEIVSLFMNVQALCRCLLRSVECDGSCNLHDLHQPIQTEFLDMLKKTTFAKVA